MIGARYEGDFDFYLDKNFSLKNTVAPIVDGEF